MENEVEKTFVCFKCGKVTPQKETPRIICLNCQKVYGVIDLTKEAKHE